jgi:hypothetical protein
MPQHNTRRAFIEALGGVTVIRASSTTDSGDTPSASDLLIPDTVIPTGFKQYSNPDSFPLVNPVESVDQQLDSVDISSKAYWKGDTQSIPQWAILSVAVVADETISRATVEEAITQSYEGPIATINTGTGMMTEFEQTYSWDKRNFNWDIDIIGVPLSGNSKADPTVALREQTQIRFFDQIYLVTTVFGPGNASPSVGSLLEQYANIQYDRVQES